VSETKGHLGRVLVVDDDPGLRKLCRRLLANEGWHVTVVEHGRAAVQAIQGASEPFDCVVSDVNMPELDGYGLLREIRQSDTDLPVLLMTGDPSLDGAVRAIDQGAVSYLAKPFDQEAMASAVARAARRHGVARMRRRAEAFAQELDGDLVSRFEKALASSWLAFQPIIDLPARRVFAFEALIRTDEPTMHRPDILIATAERLDRIHQLGRTVRAAAVMAAPKLPPDVLLFINVHGLELSDEDLYASTGAFSELAPKIVLEITERIGVDEVAGPARVAMLRNLGFRIAVDDLGAGYAALGALATLEPEIVKLDMSLVRDINRHTTKRRVVGAITTLVKELGGRVVAEGVETVAERDTLLDAGIDLFQGWLFARAARDFILPKL